MSTPTTGWLRRAVLTALVVVLCTVAGTRGRAAEVIHSFDSDVQVAKDGDLTVTETIRVRAEGQQIRRGIFRDFPLTFTDADGKLREVSFKLLDVMRDGKPEPHFTQRRGGVLHIYAGDKDVLILRGDHTYTIRYRTGRQIRWFDGKAELNWNVTGNFWDFTIERAKYSLHLVDGLRPTRWTAFTGPLGARGTDWRGAIGNDGVLRVESTRRLLSREGFTVVAALPDGSVEPPSEATLFWYALSDNRRWIFSGVGFVLVLVYYLAAWNAVGRDPRGGTIIPLFHPPRDVSPALANYIENWGFGRDRWRALTAAALSLAVKGLLRFDESEGTLTLKSTGRQAPGTGVSLPPGERAILNFVNGLGGTAKIDRSNGSLVATAGSNFTSAIEGENRHRFFRRNLSYVIVGVIMTVAVVAGVIIFGGLRDEDIMIIAGTAFASFWLGMFLVPIAMTLFRANSFASVVRALMTVAVLAIFISIASNIVQVMFPNGLSDVLPLLGSVIADYPFPIALIAGFATLNGLFVYLMRAPTALGRPVMDQLAGFKLYLETAESDRLNRQAPEITAERFEALLPYAVALHAEKPWSEAFESALRRAHPGDAAPMQHYRPAWHSGSWSTGSFSGAAVAATVAGASSALASAVPVSSGSSGFSGGGGGSSGGGGGGGGGGGW
jgi:hypothetical protein